MDSFGYSATIAQAQDRQELFGTHGNMQMSRPLFTVIPPERIGLNGEYDHSGLAKRVEHLFCSRFPLSCLEQVSITQRGRVVILSGKVANRQLLNQMVDAAFEITGTFAVEVCGVIIA